MFRIGYGNDIHRLEAGKPLILGGVSIESEKGAVGHSDADCLTHAVTDASPSVSSTGAASAIRISRATRAAPTIAALFRRSWRQTIAHSPCGRLRRPSSNPAAPAAKVPAALLMSPTSVARSRPGAGDIAAAAPRSPGIAGFAPLIRPPPVPSSVPEGRRSRSPGIHPRAERRGRRCPHHGGKLHHPRAEATKPHGWG